MQSYGWERIQTARAESCAMETRGRTTGKGEKPASFYSILLRTIFLFAVYGYATVSITPSYNTRRNPRPSLRIAQLARRHRRKLVAEFYCCPTPARRSTRMWPSESWRSRRVGALNGRVHNMIQQSFVALRCTHCCTVQYAAPCS